MILKESYQQFLRWVADKKWLRKYKNAIVLGERFIGSYYIVVFESEGEE